jgi:two-component sensor histidine kinase
VGLLVRLCLLVVLALVPAAVVAVHHETRVRADAEARVAADAVRLAEFASAEIDQVFAGARTMADALALLDEVRTAAPSFCGGTRVALAAQNPQFRWLNIADADGRLLCANPALPDRMSVADRDYFARAMEGEGTVVGAAVEARGTGGWVIPVARGFQMADGSRGVLVGGISVAWLDERLAARDLGPGSVVSLTDRNGLVLLRRPSLEGGPMPRPIRDESRWMLEAPGPGTVRGEGLDARERILAFVPPAASGGGLLVAVGMSTADAFAEIDAATRANAVVVAGGLLLGLAAALAVGHLAVRRPVARLLDAMERHRAGDRDARARIGDGGSEIGRLGRAFDDLADALAERDRERDGALAERQLLLEELKHRAKNGFASIEALLAIEERREPDPGLRARLAAARGRTATMARLYDLLHRSGAGGTVDAGRYLGEVCAAIRGGVLGGPSPVRLVERLGALPMPVDRAVPLGLLVNELVTNAAKHAFPARGGTIEVELAALDGGGWRLVVADDGVGLPEERLRTASGVGLSLSFGLARQAGGELARRAGPGTRYELVVPPAAAAAA